MDELSLTMLDDLLQWCSHKDSEVRYRANEKLIEIFSEKDVPANVLQCIRKGLHDRDEFVRCTCLEFLEDHVSLARYDAVAPFLLDKDGIVRGEAAIVLGKIGDKRAVSDIMAAIGKSTDAEKVPLYFGLYLLGVQTALSGLIQLLRSREYIARCAAANILPLCAKDKTKIRIINALSRAMEIENTKAAKSSLVKALEKLRRR